MQIYNIFNPKKFDPYFFKGKNKSTLKIIVFTILFMTSIVLNTINYICTTKTVQL